MHLLLCYTAPQRYTCAHDMTSSPQMRTVPYLVDNPRVGFVQARWTFLNAEESFLTKARRPGGLCSSGGSCAYCGVSPERALVSPGPLVRLPLARSRGNACAARLRARRRSRSRSTSTASASSLCTLRPARSSTSTAPPARPAPPRPAPRLPSGALTPGALAGASQAPRLARLASKGELHPHQPHVAMHVLLSCVELRSARRRVARQGHPCGGRLEQPHNRGRHGPQPARVHGRLGRRVPQRRHRAERGARDGPRRAAQDRGTGRPCCAQRLCSLLHVTTGSARP